MEGQTHFGMPWVCTSWQQQALFYAWCRDCGNDSDASDHIFDDLGDGDCVAMEHSDCSVLLLCLWLNWAALHLLCSVQSPTRRLGSPGSGWHLHVHHVRVALRHNKEVRIRCAEQGLHEVVAHPWSQPRDCARTGNRADLHGARDGCAGYFLTLCHQLASLPWSLGFCVHEIGAGSVCSSQWAVLGWPCWPQRLPHVQVSLSLSHSFHLFWYHSNIAIWRHFFFCFQYHSCLYNMQDPPYRGKIAQISIWFRMVYTQIISWVYNDFLILRYPPNINIRLVLQFWYIKIGSLYHYWPWLLIPCIRLYTTTNTG